MLPDLREATVSFVRRVQALPYAWPAPPDAASCRRAGRGSCASKHALLAEELQAFGLSSLPLFVVGELVPPMLRCDAEFAEAKDLREVHECLTVITPWAGPLRVDVTWDPPLVRSGLPGDLEWDGHHDMPLAVGEGGSCWAVPREGLREAKEALRTRLYREGQRAVRDRALAAMVRRFDAWRSQDAG